jgi:hypothetical protein
MPRWAIKKSLVTPRVYPLLPTHWISLCRTFCRQWTCRYHLFPSFYPSVEQASQERASYFQKSSILWLPLQISKSPNRSLHIEPRSHIMLSLMGHDSFWERKSSENWCKLRLNRLPAQWQEGEKKGPRVRQRREYDSWYVKLCSMTLTTWYRYESNAWCELLVLSMT